MIVKPFRLLCHGICGVAAPALFALAASPINVYAADLPELQPGMWKLVGVADGRRVDGKKCMNPSRDIAEENAVFERAGCKVSQIKRSGSRYTFNAECEMKTRSGRVLNSDRTSVLTVDGDGSFQLRVRGTTNGRPIAETVTGTRIGDCDK